MKFSRQVNAWAEKAKLRQLVVFRESSQELLLQANVAAGKGGRMPVDTGFLRNSIAASKEGVPMGQGRPRKGVKYSEPVNGDPSLVFATLQIGDKVWAGWTAVYAARIEHGFIGEDSAGRTYAQSGRGFFRAAAQRWDQIVDEATTKAKRDIP
ncbi:hypothetical protein [Pseudoxanthomonas winnipegensis]|uniref:hypothetical protein n=1 Tax=Pseudoxanthomonas winnipegensis TaxID=2480810 RepID=UPI001F2ADC8E|nr:hypothetical protein [Pseudoxanthomonas winnipegensis]